MVNSIIMKGFYNGGIFIKKINQKSNLIILRNTEESDLDFVVNTESESENAQYVLQWSKEQHKAALTNEDILHLVIEDKKTKN